MTIVIFGLPIKFASDGVLDMSCNALVFHSPNVLGKFCGVAVLIVGGINIYIYNIYIRSKRSKIQFISTACFTHRWDRQEIQLKQNNL